MEQKFTIYTTKNLQETVGLLSTKKCLLGKINVRLPSNEQMEIINYKSNLTLKTEVAHLKIKKSIIDLSCNKTDDIFIMNKVFKTIILLSTLPERFAISAKDDPNSSKTVSFSKHLKEIKDMYSERITYVARACKTNIIREELNKIAICKEAVMSKTCGEIVIYSSNFMYIYRGCTLIRACINLNGLGIDGFTPPHIENNSVDYHFNSLINRLINQKILISTENNKE